MAEKPFIVNKSYMSHKSYKSYGLGMVEIIVVIAVILVAFTAILQLFKLQAQNERAKREELQAYALLGETLEAVRAVRDHAWTNVSSLTLGADYYPVISGGAWTLSGTDPGPIDGFTRWVVFNSVRRDGSDNIVPVGGTVDPDTLLITAYAEWQSRGATKTRSLATYLTDRL